jgi:PKD repeat protein
LVTINNFNIHRFRNCDTLDGIAHSYYLGKYTATLTLTDGRYTVSKSVNIEVIDGNQNEPVIDIFDAEPKFGYDLITSQFNVKVSDADGDRADLVCTLDYGDGGSKVGDCDTLDGVKHSYTIGDYVAKLTVSDGKYSDSQTVIIEVIDSNVYPPEITLFDAEPKFGYDELTSTFSVGVFDKDGNDLSCELDFGDGDKKTTTNCSSLNGLKHTYTSIGNYTAKLTVRDTKFNDVETLNIEVADGNVYPPAINIFNGEPNMGVDMIETHFTINVTDMDGDRNNVVCTLEFGGGTSKVGDCDALDGVSHIYNVGEYKARLVVFDGEFRVYGYEDIVVYDSSVHRPVVEYIDVGTRTELS